MDRLEDDADIQRNRLNQETARIPWQDLQRFFARGAVIWVSGERDLIEAALRIARDDAQGVANEISNGNIAPVTDEQARHWLETDASLWAVVVKPWILVQEAGCTSGSTPTPAHG